MSIYTNFQTSANTVIYNIAADLPFASWISNNPTPLLERLIEAQNNERLNIHKSTNMDFTIEYNESTFNNDLTKMTSLWFKNYLSINSIVQESLSAPLLNDTFEVHAIENDPKDPRYIRITSLVYSGLKTDQMWNFYLFKWGTPYINFHVSRRDILLYEN